MIIVNIIASALLGTLLLIYIRFKRKTKKINLLLILILISLLPLISILRKGTYESGDLSYHIAAIFSMFNSIADGNLIPRWGADLYYGYGSPYHIIMYFFPRYIISITHLFGVPMLESVKIFLGLSFVLSGISMYFWLKEQFGSKAGFIGGIFYLFAPYHLVDMHFRVELGEMAFFVLTPFLMLASKKLSNKISFTWVLILGLTFAFSVLSHQAIALIFTPFLVFYAAILVSQTRLKKIKLITAFLISGLTGVALSAFYWIPILSEGGRYTWVRFIFSTIQKVSFQGINEYLYSPWIGGLLFQGPHGELSFILGYFHWLVVILTVFLLFTHRLKKNSKQVVIFSLISFAIVFFLMLNISQPLWSTIPLIKYSQNSYRLLVILIFFSSTIAGIIISNWKNKWVIPLCILVIMTTSLNWGNRRTIPEISTDSYFQNIIGTFQSGNYGNDYDFPIWADPIKTPFRKTPSQHLVFLSGEGIVREISRNSTRHEYVLLANTNVLLRENTFYFPGWKVTANNDPVIINYKNKLLPGIITFSLPKGLYKIEVVFQNTPVRNLGDRITFITILLIIALLICKNLRKLKKNKKVLITSHFFHK